jgi:single-stranded-DNA-specific exonuclease
MRSVTVNEIVSVGDGKHTKLVLGKGNHTLSAMYFSASPTSLGIYVGDKIDLLFNIDINEWGGRESVQLIVRDIKITGSEKAKNESERARFEEIRGGAPFSQEEDVMPSRADFAEVYKLMLTSLRSGVDTLSHRDITSHFRTKDDGAVIGYAKLKFIIMVLKELNLVSITDVGDEVYKFNIHYTTSKTELDKSSILRKLRSQLARSR